MDRRDREIETATKQPRVARAGVVLGSRTLALMAMIAVAAGLFAAVRGVEVSNGRTFWLFAGAHHRMYVPIMESWNAKAATDTSMDRVEMKLLSYNALERRMLSSFYTGTPSADLIEVERKIAGNAFKGPLEQVGFVDLTDRLEREGLLDEINAPSFGPWTSRGRIFGLPHDVHPVMLGYRADLVEAAGLDMSGIETWDDFIRVLKPLQKDLDGDGVLDRFLINMWPNNADHLEVLILQAGGAFFDDADRCVIASEVNADVLATIAWWCVGPDPVAADAPNFSLAGNQKKADGYVVSSLFPDWMCDIWRNEIPTLSGKMKMMPIPAWRKGGLRTSVWGGTMLGIPRAGAAATGGEAEFERLWTFAKHLYLSKELAKELWRSGSIITPVRKHWADPVYDEPQAYFSGQATGRLFIEQAPSIPARSSNPYNTIAMQRTQAALETLAKDLANNKGMTREAVRLRAAEVLGIAQRYVEGQIERNVFLSESVKESAVSR
jgi:arabinosaccharide transport system substrate-binding protein